MHVEKDRKVEYTKPGKRQQKAGGFRTGQIKHEKEREVSIDENEG